MIELPKTDPRVSCFVEKGYRGRRPVRIHTAKTYTVSDYWSGGSREYTSFVDLNTHQCLTYEQVGFKRQTQSNMFNLPIGEVTIQPGIAVVVHSIFCGKDTGYRIYIAEEDLKRFEG